MTPANKPADGLLDWEQLEHAAALLKALGHPLRLRLVELLEQQELSVGQLQQVTGAQQSHTSQQLLRLKALGIVSSRREGNQVYYSVANTDVFKILDCLRQHERGQARTK